MFCLLCVGVFSAAHGVRAVLLYEPGRRQREVAAESSSTGESLLKAELYSAS